MARGDLPPSDLWRKIKPKDADWLWTWIEWYTGIRVARQSVCANHQAPFDALCCWHFDRPSKALLLGPRGGGKSLIQSIDAHLDSRFNRKHFTRVLAGSLAQAQQVYGGLNEFIVDGEGPHGWTDADTIRKLTQRMATYHNGSTVAILPGTAKGVRGPHVPSLKLDEVDEIDPDVRQFAMGMSMEKGGVAPKLTMSSTHHNLGGSMEQLMTTAREANAENPGVFPFHSFCTWEVLEHCDTDRSGPAMDPDSNGYKFANCPTCPIRKWCYEDNTGDAMYKPKAKRARGGHYTIDSLIQKTFMVTPRVIDSDYFCKGPKTAGVWFTHFNENVHVKPVELQPNEHLYVAIDCGVSIHVGAVFFQAWNDPRSGRPRIRIVADYYAEGLHSEQAARAILAVCRDKLAIDPRRIRKAILDPASRMTSSLGPSARSEYERVYGEENVDLPPARHVKDGLDFLEKIVMLADETTTLEVHPRCEHTIRAFKGYHQRKVSGRWTGTPADPQHPFEEIIDSIRYGLWYIWPDGYPVPRNFDRVHASVIT